jgi:Protein of unknown function (DUF3551)
MSAALAGIKAKRSQSHLVQALVMERTPEKGLLPPGRCFQGWAAFSRNILNNHGEEIMRATPMRATFMSVSLGAAGILAAAFADSTSLASAQSSSSYPFCLFTDEAQSCYYTSIAQCMASRRGAADFCQPNNTYVPNSRRG